MVVASSFETLALQAPPAMSLGSRADEGLERLSHRDETGEMMEINGVAHIFLTASNYQISREFYRKLLPFLGLKPVIDDVMNMDAERVREILATVKPLAAEY